MIDRYSGSEMKYLWSKENRFNNWLKVELSVCYAYYKKEIISKRDYSNIINKAQFNMKRIDKIEKKVKHDVIAFLTSVAEYVGKSSRFIHKGMTSSDMIDTANALILKESCIKIEKGLNKLYLTVLRGAKRYKAVPIIGRSHGVHAEPTTVGLKMLVWADDLKRSLEMMKWVQGNVSRGKISGAVGNYANIDPEIETMVLKHLKLKRADISSQIVSRDVYADYVYAISRIGNIIDKIALQIRLLQRT
ncbi:adenylosuccinate lyase, partial [candidate division WOR-3 bacterium]|nr:adenylosuccinate lyase [candidate division WOR-3 bacterium]